MSLTRRYVNSANLYVSQANVCLPLLCVSNANTFAILTPAFDDVKMVRGMNSNDGERAFYAAFGRMLAEARRRKRISQEMLADELGLTRTSVTNIEKGRQPVQLYSLYRIARLLRADVKDLLPSTAIFDRPEQSKGLSVSRSEWLENMNVKLEQPTGDRDAQHRTTGSKTARRE